jgi:hypothetical protein
MRVYCTDEAVADNESRLANVHLPTMQNKKKKEIKIKKQEKKKTKKKEQRHTKRRRSCKRVKSPVKLQIKSGSSYYITLHSRQLDKRARTVM